MSNEVISVEAEEINLETKINDTLVKNNVTESVIQALRDNYLWLKIKDQSDREGYNAVKEARKECKSLRVMAEKICKKGREDAVVIQKAWVAKEKEVAGKIGEVESYLELQEKGYDAEKERIKAELKAKHDRQFTTRTIELNKMGASFDGTNFTLEDVSYESVLIREADDEIYNETILPAFTEIFEKNEAVRIADEKEKLEVAAKFAAQQAELLRQQQELLVKQEEMNKAKELQERIEREKEQGIAELVRKERESVQSKRLNQLLPFNPTGSDVNMATLWELSEEDFTINLSKKKKDFEAAQAEKQKEIEEAAATKERERIAEVSRKADEQRVLDEKKKKEELEKATDKDKWAVYIKELNEVKFPAVTGQYFKSKLLSAKKKVEEINLL